MVAMHCGIAHVSKGGWGTSTCVIIRSHSDLDIFSSLVYLVESLNRICLPLSASNTNRAFPLWCADTILTATDY